MYGYTQPDPYTTNRRDFTAALLNHPTAQNATPAYAKIHNDSKALLRLLINHKAIEPNINQTFMTPAASKNKVYFMWDFIGRTLGFLYMVNPERPRGELWDDVKSRLCLADVLIRDDEKLDKMMDDTYGDKTDPAEFGEEIVEASKKAAEGLTMWGVEM
ncbi:hypothetical protein EJ08DRAFT_650537 [Tothia fuscella]|uniref:Uncharacterized protein n=1 Tax=Tothia fuscella TaxID=1048955 RepID=A0A9P4NNV9_9PEZI|nr:hypothetical protein EJ08DRAFT_650537 [Tothia fuscella]